MWTPKHHIDSYFVHLIIINLASTQGWFHLLWFMRSLYVLAYFILAIRALVVSLHHVGSKGLIAVRIPVFPISVGWKAVKIFNAKLFLYRLRLVHSQASVLHWNVGPQIKP